MYVFLRSVEMHDKKPNNGTSNANSVLAKTDHDVGQTKSGVFGRFAVASRYIQYVRMVTSVSNATTDNATTAKFHFFDCA